MTTSTLLDARDVAALVDVARRVVPMTWGLDTFVAANPLHGFEHLPFEEAAEHAADLFDARAYPPARDAEGRAVLPPLRIGRRPATALLRYGTAAVADLVDAVVAHWCATHHGAPAQGAADGLYRSWTAHAVHDPDLRRLIGADLRRIVAALPDQPEHAVAHVLGELGVGRNAVVAYLEAQLARLPGWAAAFARRSDQHEPGALVDFVATRLAVEHLLLAARVPVATPPAPDEDVAGEMERTRRLADAQTAAEAEYRDRLLGALQDHRGAAPTVPVDAQVVCCIDVRSEGLRRHLEQTGAYETLGFAGFFGLPIAFAGADAHESAEPNGHAGAAEPHCPVILDPRATITDEAPARRHDVHDAFVSAKSGSCSGYVLADAAGWVLGLAAMASSLAPTGVARLGRALRKPADRRRLRIDEHDDDRGLSPAEQAELALGALTAMGLTTGFAPLVVLCGHRSDHRNNPYRSALHCGACGGNPGGDNARVLATICNRAEVRAALAARGIVIGDDTWFVGAEHETTDDVVILLDTETIPARFADRVAALQRDLAVAGAANRDERLARSAGVVARRRSARRSVDPALVAPEWGLAGNAAIVVGPRSLTAGADLDRRVFLHSYAAGDDPSAAVLEAIMTGPVVVAHWISAQYYFSSVDPQRFGAGRKPFHNVIGRIGVGEGASFDLRTGLPLESVSFDGRLVHEPLRLLVVVDAPTERVDLVVARNPVLRRLTDNGWVSVVARHGDAADGFAIRGRDGTWAPWRREDAAGSDTPPVGHDDQAPDPLSVPEPDVEAIG
jgi:uncharacterized protein